MSSGTISIVSLLLLGLTVAIWMAARSLVEDGTVKVVIGTAIALVPPLCAALLGARGGWAYRSDANSRQRRGWRLVGFGCVFSMASMLVLVSGAAIVPLVPEMRDLLAAGLHAMAVLLLLAGMLHWVQRFSLPASVSLGLDLFAVTLLGYLLVGSKAATLLTTAAQAGLTETAVMLSYHGLDVVLLLAAVTVLSQIGRTELGGGVVLATFGVAAIAGSDLYVGWLAGASAEGLGEAMVQTLGLVGAEVSGDLGWNLGFLFLVAGAARHRARDVSADEYAVPLLERSATWETVWALIPFAMLASAIAAWNGSTGEASVTRLGFLGLVVLLLLRCGMVAVHNVRLARTASTDPLTGAFNHRHFQERIFELAEDAADSRSSLSLVVIDVDDFELLNDTCGHAEGDRFLREIAWVLRQNIAPKHELFRSGGDEFALALPGMDPVEAGELAMRLAELVGTHVKGAGGVHPSLTIGVSGLPAHTTDPHELVHLAEGTLYWGKLNGKRKVTVYDPVVVTVLSADQRVRMIEQHAQLRAVLALARALDARDGYTARHSENVARYAVAIAHELGWTSDRQELLRIAGLLHDVGKIGVRDATLRKAEQLTDAEWQEMRKHPVLSARMIAGVAPEEILPWVIAHHERYDGRGYPRRLTGEDIPLGARILAVADSFDAMTSSRSYRPGRPVPAAIREIAACAGDQFDPLVVKGFLAAIRNGHLVIEEIRGQEPVDAQLPMHDEPEVAATGRALALLDPEFSPVDDDRLPVVDVEADEELVELASRVERTVQPDGSLDEPGSLPQPPTPLLPDAGTPEEHDEAA